MTDGIRGKPFIDLVGLFPPPYAGVAVYLTRLGQALDKEGYLYRTHPAYFRAGEGGRLARVSPSLARFIHYCLSSKGDIVHLHEASWKLLLSIWILTLIRGSGFLVTVHGFDKGWPWVFDDGRRPRRRGIAGGLAYIVSRRALKSSDGVIVVNRGLGSSVLGLGVDPSRVHLVSPFIPPGQEGAVESLPREVQDFLSLHDPIILSFAAVRLMDGMDVYGVDLLLGALKNMKKDYPAAGLLVTISWVSGLCQAHYEHLKSLVQQLGLVGHVLFAETLPDPSILYGSATVFARATCTDGDSLSVRESLAAGLPVVASDASSRPREAILFTNRDAQSLASALKRAIEESPKHRKGRRRARQAASRQWRQLLGLYDAVRPDRRDRMRGEGRVNS